MNGGARINLEDAWPISDEEGRGLTGYTFTVENKCEDPVNYIIALESLESTKGLEYLNNEYIKLAIDDELEKRYGSLDAIDNVVLENDTEVIRETREVTSATVQGNSINEHTIRIWLSEDAPLTEQNKVFASRVRITGGQGVENNNVQPTSAACFEIDETTGEITKYLTEKEECGESVVIPASVNGTQVKIIDTNAFKKNVLISSEITDNIKERRGVGLISDEGLLTAGTGKAYYFIKYQEGSETEELIAYLIDYAAENLGIDYEIPSYVYGKDTVTADGKTVGELALGQIETYIEMDGDTIGERTVHEEQRVSVDSVDFSIASNLEKIEPSAFSNVPTSLDSDTSYEIFDISLTSLNFGNNDKKIVIEQNAFARIDVTELTLYTNYNYDEVDDGYVVYKSNKPFGGATIDTLTIKASKDYSGLTSYVLSDVIVNELNVAEGVTYLDEGTGTNKYSQFYGANINKLTLPSTLTNENIIGRDLGQPNKDFNFNEENQAKINELVINTPITNVGMYAFSTSKIKKIKLPDTVTEIDDNAFFDSAIETIDLSSNLITIGSGAFSNSSLKGNLFIPASVESIGSSAFSITSISSLEIEDTAENPSKLNTIYSYAFSHTNLTNIIIPQSVTRIEAYAFKNLPSTGTITLKGRTNTDGMTLGDNWNGDAQIAYE